MSNYQLIINRCRLVVVKNVWKVGLVVAGVFTLLAPLVLAQTVGPTGAMLAGNQHYEAGEFVEAVEVYESIVAAGIQDSALFYNLGNAYFKQGDLGRSILNYRRAQYLDPRDSDIAANLAITRLQTLDKFESDEGAWVNLVRTAEEWFTLTEAALLALFLWLLVCLFAIAAILTTGRLQRVSLWAMGIAGVFLLAGLFSMANRYYLQNSYPPAVIVAEEVDVTSGPGPADQYLVEFNLHSGAEIRLIESRPGWRRIALPGNDFQGWVPVEAVEPVIIQN